ncbi:unnamed protein product [Sphenostylis stenocarpa]|uniref:Uncharacterized protein n=1 Tax=Sphenostylis stenocarpa TaxID=92480 RepID=A0AA86SIR0_9FABA|nr:unnamed protein product [Sphenostylis stenocarpa]
MLDHITNHHTEQRRKLKMPNREGKNRVDTGRGDAPRRSAEKTNEGFFILNDSEIRRESLISILLRGVWLAEGHGVP